MNGVMCDGHTKDPEGVLRQGGSQSQSAGIEREVDDPFSDAEEILC